MALEKRELDMGHARALLSLGDPKLQNRLFARIRKEGMSVRSVERTVKEMMETGVVPANGKKGGAAGGDTSLSAHYKELRKELSNIFKAKVQFTCSDKGRGKISIPFSNEGELVRIMEMFDQLKR